jgi:hypothetical protein
MNANRIALSQEILVAFVDGELPAAEAAAIQAALQHDSGAREIVRRLRISADIAARVSHGPLDESLPDDLVESIQNRMRENFQTAAARRIAGYRFALAAGIVLALALGAAAGYLARDLSAGYVTAAAPGSDDLTSAYEATLLGSLNSGASAGQAFGYDSPGVGQGKITLGSRFTTSSGSICREFQRAETRGDTHSTGNGIACQSPNGGWNIVFTSKAS